MEKYSTAYSAYNLEEDSNTPPRNNNDSFSMIGKRDSTQRDYGNF